jgi:glycosyltransferase involved in cell wall biosynthesis
VVLTGFVDDETLAWVYSGALMLVYPSLYEGFGLPRLEAMQCGTPVITSNRSSLPEIVGDAATLVDPTDEDAISSAMYALYADAALRQAHRAAGLHQAARFSWQHTAEQTVAGYRRVMEAT